MKTTASPQCAESNSSLMLFYLPAEHIHHAPPSCCYSAECSSCIRIHSVCEGSCSLAPQKAGNLLVKITGLTTVWLLPFTAIVNSALSMLRPTARVSMFTPAAHAWLKLRCLCAVCHSH